MDNKKLILLLLLLGGGYLVWRTSKAAAQGQVPDAPVDVPPADMPPSDLPSDLPPADVSPAPKSQKDCPEGYVFVPTDCLVPPCEGGNCIPVSNEPEPMPVKGGLVDIVEVPVETTPTPVKDPFTEFFSPVEPIQLIKDPYSQIFKGDVAFSGFSFMGYDKNTLTLQDNIKQGVVKESNFN